MANKLKHFAIIKIDANAESPMIGIITNIPHNERNSFIVRFDTAVREHFDVNNLGDYGIPNLFDGSPYHDVNVNIDGVLQQIRILETWMY